MSLTREIVVDCADHAGFLRLVSGKKTIVTRANNDEYSTSRVGDSLKLVDNQTQAQIFMRILSVDIFNSLSDLFNNTTIPEETFNKKFTNVEELKNEYEHNRPEYMKLIEQNGLIVWRVVLISD